MNKETKMTMKLNPYFESTIETSRVVWSHDENSYQFNFDFTDFLCDKPFELTNGKPRILLDFLDDKNADIQIYPLEIESEKLGQAYFIIPDKVLGYVGIVKASLTIDFSNKTYDLGNFIFKMKKSPIDDKMPELQFWVDEFDQAFELFKHGLDEFNEDIKESNAKVDEIKQRIEENDIVKQDDFLELNKNVKFSFKSNFYKNQCLIAGHRGMMNLAPENSKISFESAGKYGLKAIETDCHETTDGKFFLYHDADLSSQTNSSGKLYEKSSVQLNDVVYTKAKGSDIYPNTKLATLEEYLQVASKYNMFCLLEIGVIRNFNNFLNIIYKFGMEGNVIIFGNQYNIAAIRKLDKNIAIGLVTWKVITKTDVDFCVSNNIDMLGIAISDSGVSVNMNSEIIEYAHSKNIIIDAYIVNTAAELNWCKNNHIDIITTDVFVEV